MAIGLLHGKQGLLFDKNEIFLSPLNSLSDDKIEDM